MRSLHMLGARTAVGLDYGKLAGGLLSTAGDVYEGVQADEAKKKLKASDQKKADAAITADNAAALAKAAALTSTALAAMATGVVKKGADAKAAADQKALTVATAAQDRAGAAAGPAASEVRAASAQKALEAATAQLQAKPEDIYSQNLVEAWNWVLNKGQNAEIVKKSPDKAPEQPWYDKKIVGPVKVWHAGAAGAGAGVLYIAVKKGLFRFLGIG